MTARTLRAAALVLIGAITMSNLAPAGARAEVAIKGASGRDVKIADTSRIVAIGGDVTEILYALKADAKIAAVDSTSQFPVQALKEKPNVGYIRALSAEGVLSDTSADAVIKLAGAENAASGIEGYKPLVEEAATELVPDAIVTMRHSSSTFTSDQILSVKGLQASPAGQNKRVIEMAGLYLLSFGPRSAHAARDLMAALYPGLSDRRAGE